MSDSTLDKFQHLEKSQEKIMGFLGSCDSVKLRQSQRHSWSMIQAMRHIYTSEGSIASYMEKKIQAGDGMPKENLKGRLALFLPVIVFFCE